MISNGPSADSTAPIPAARAPQADPGRPDPAPDGPADGPADGSADGPKDGHADGPAGGSADGKQPGPRRITVRRVTKTVVALAVVLGVLALGDRWAVLYAEKMAGQEVQKALKLRAAPEVHIDSFPFVAQVATGHVDRVEVNVPDVSAGRVSVAQVKGTVDDVRIVGSLSASVKGAVLSRVRGEVFLDFDDLNREVGASQVRLTPGPGNTVRAHGELPVAGKRAEVRARAQLQRTGDHGLAMTVADTRLVVPGLLTYVPGDGGGLQLAGPQAEKVDERELRQATGQQVSPGQLLQGKALDALVEHPALLEPTGVDPSLIEGLRKVREPKVAKPMQFAAQLPDDMPGDLRLRDISVQQDGIRAELTGADVPLGNDAR